MNILFMMLFNESTKTYHPIYYMESPFPSSTETTKIIRFKSKGHHPRGLSDRADAVNEIENKIPLLSEQGYTTIKEIDDVINWTGEDMPIDIQFRDKSWLDEKLVIKQ